MSQDNNVITRTDSYKFSHWLQYPPGTRHVQSYIEARWSEEFPDIQSTTFFGLRAFLNKIAGEVVSYEMIAREEWKAKAHGEPFNEKGWWRIMNKHGGRLPISIRAVHEGLNIPISNVLLTIENTDPECFWLTSYLETRLLRAVWYPTTVATISRYCKELIGRYLEETGDPAGLPFKLHDFGARGVSSGESAEIGGAAHLVNFMGTDTYECLNWLKANYGVDLYDMPAFSIPAAEHSTITTWGGEPAEIDSFRNMLNQFGGEGKLVAVVSDSYNIYEACRKWGSLRKEIEESGTTLVVRPDSGDPVKVTLEVIKLLEEHFGTEENSKGYRVLNPCIRIIQGDGVDPNSIEAILENYKQHGYSADNIAFGMGGGLLQKVNRDTFGWAMKASAIQVNDLWRPVFKEPAGMSSKNSKRGRLQLFKDAAGNYITIDMDSAHTPPTHGHCVMREVFRDGEILREDNFNQIRAFSNG